MKYSFYNPNTRLIASERIFILRIFKVIIVTMFNWKRLTRMFCGILAINFQREIKIKLKE